MKTEALATVATAFPLLAGEPVAGQLHKIPSNQTSPTTIPNNPPAIIIMKTLFTSQASSLGGRSGSISSPDGLLNITLGNPLKPGEEKLGPNPELLFAAAYAACYHGALLNAAKRLDTEMQGSTVRALVSLLQDDQDGYRLSVELHAQIPGVNRVMAQNIMTAAHETCPYSKALRGDAAVTLVVD